MLDGQTRLIDLEENMHISFDTNMNETIAGFILEKLDRMAVVGDEIEEGGYIFRVEEIESMRISKVHCIKTEEEEEDDEFGFDDIEEEQNASAD